MKARDDNRIDQRCRRGEQACPHLKEKWIKTKEAGTEFWMYSQFNECLEKHSKSIAINKMKLYVQAVVNVLTLIDTKMEVKA